VFQLLMTSKTVKIVVALGGACVLAASAVAADRASNGRAPNDAAASKSIILGKTSNYPDAACARPRRCQVVARVTGIQMAADGRSNPFRVPRDGQLVSWWLTLPRLTDAQIKSFNKLFGGEPKARLAVVRRGVRDRYRLVRQSDPVPLADKLGTKGRVRLRLPQPLAVKRGDYVALTAETWLPSFAVNLNASRNNWLASRVSRRCQTPPSNNVKRFERYYKHNDAQLQASTAKPYQCSYETARLIYWARLVPAESAAPEQGTEPQEQSPERRKRRDRR
jgi:hypothetical protein